LGPQVAVPDHLRERDRHRDAPALELQPARRLEAREGEVQPGVAALVVVPQQRRLGIGVLVAAEVEVAAHAKQQLLDPELEARLRSSFRVVVELTKMLRVHSWRSRASTLSLTLYSSSCWYAGSWAQADASSKGADRHRTSAYRLWLMRRILAPGPQRTSHSGC